MSYKKKLTDAKKLMTQGSLALYDCVKLLIEVFDDREFRVQENLEDDLQADEWLTSGYLPDYIDYSFLNLRALLKFAPERERWGAGKLGRLYAEMLEAHRAAKAQDSEPVARPRITRAAHEEVAKALQHEQAQTKYLRDRISELESENTRLREEVAMLKGRIQELERMAKRELVGA